MLSFWDKSVQNSGDAKPGARRRVPLPVTFLLIDELSCIDGYDGKHKCGITSNEVRDVRADVMVVKSFKGGVIASGLYSQIKDVVNAADGRFNANLYIAYRPDPKGPLQLGSIRFKGAALHAWSEFRYKCATRRVGEADIKEYYLQAIRITAFAEGKTGAVKYRTPVFSLTPASEEAEAQAKALDVTLQNYLKQYFARTKTEQAVTGAAPASTPQPEPEQDEPPADHAAADAEANNGEADSEVPF
jgi:hypothetical protein